MFANTLKKALLNAWNMLIDFPLPFLRDNEKDTVENVKEIAILTQVFFPLVGIICALLALLLGAILNNLLHPIPAAAVFAGLLTYFCVYKDDGRGLAGLTALLSFKRKQKTLDQTLFDLPDSVGDTNSPVVTLIMVLVVLFKLFAFFLMSFYAYTYWLAAIFVLEFAIEGDLVAMDSLEQKQPLLEIKKSKQSYIWYVAGFLVLFVLFKTPVASLLLFGAAFGLSYAVKTYCKARLDGIDSKIIGLTAYVFELFALLLGLILLTKGRVIFL